MLRIRVKRLARVASEEAQAVDLPVELLGERLLDVGHVVRRWGKVRTGETIDAETEAIRTAVSDQDGVNWLLTVLIEGVDKITDRGGAASSSRRSIPENRRGVVAQRVFRQVLANHDRPGRGSGHGVLLPASL